MMLWVLHRVHTVNFHCPTLNCTQHTQTHLHLSLLLLVQFWITFVICSFLCSQLFFFFVVANGVFVHASFLLLLTLVSALVKKSLPNWFFVFVAINFTLKLNCGGAILRLLAHFQSTTVFLCAELTSTTHHETAVWAQHCFGSLRVVP